MGWEPQDLRLQQLSDPDIGILLIKLELTNKRPKWESVSSGTSALKTLWSQWNRLEIIGGILFMKFESNDGQSTIKKWLSHKARNGTYCIISTTFHQQDTFELTKLWKRLKQDFTGPI